METKQVNRSDLKFNKWPQLEPVMNTLLKRNNAKVAVAVFDDLEVRGITYQPFTHSVLTTVWYESPGEGYVFVRPYEMCSDKGSGCRIGSQRNKPDIITLDSYSKIKPWISNTPYESIEAMCNSRYGKLFDMHIVVDDRNSE